MAYKKFIFLTPFLFVIYPVLYLYSRNISLISFLEVLQPLLIASGATALLLILVKTILRALQKPEEIGVIFLSVFLLLFFSFGHFSHLIKNLVIKNLARNNFFPAPLLNEMIILIFSTLFLIFLSFLLFRMSKRKLGNLTKFLTFSGVALITIVGADIIFSGLKIERNTSFLKGELISGIEERVAQISSEVPQLLPDIYYIVLDGYGRADILKEVYGYDNSEFLNYLTEKGFYIAKKSKSNYPYSCFSVASFLNFKYVNFLKKKLEKGSQNRGPLAEMVKNNRAGLFLKKMGYKYIHVSNGYFCTIGGPIADLNLDTRSFQGSKLFETLLINTTPLGAISAPNFPLTLQGRVNKHRRQILGIFRILEKIPDIKTPTFTYAHVVAPHPPFLFDANGEKIMTGKFCLGDGSFWWPHCGSREDYIKGYINQLIYINQRVKNIVEKILSTSEVPPIIVLTADHGPASTMNWEHPESSYIEERMGILNAYYLPGGGTKLLYDSITPVNTFRVIFNYYFGTDYELLEDQSYFSRWSRPYDFINLPIEKNSN